MQWEKDEEKRKAVLEVLEREPQKPNRAIARDVGVAESFVRKLRKEKNIPLEGGTKVPRELVQPEVKPEKVRIDPRLFVLYDLAKTALPNYNATMSEWLWDCVIGYYLDHQEELELERLFSRRGDYGQSTPVRAAEEEESKSQQ